MTAEDGASTQTGTTITHLAAAMRDPDIRLLSVDVFDTLLLRRCRPELDRFRLIAEAHHQALQRAGIPSPGACALYRARLRVHKRAYDAVRLVPGEVRHRDLMAALCDECAIPASAAQEMEDAEVHCEIATLRPNRELVNALDRTGLPIVLTSDMYWSNQSLQRALGHHLPALSGCQLFLSSDLGKSKRRGDIFPIVCDVTGCAPETVIHIGDDLAADRRRAREAGLRAFWLPRPWSYRTAYRLFDRMVRMHLRRRGWIA